jgi:ADP-ribose pyrophosphatase YjhB (NUDIX family)
VGVAGGKTELGESVAETVVREVREETGIEVEILGLVGVFSDRVDRAARPGGDPK